MISQLECRFVLIGMQSNYRLGFTSNDVCFRSINSCSQFLLHHKRVRIPRLFRLRHRLFNTRRVHGWCVLWWGSGRSVRHAGGVRTSRRVGCTLTRWQLQWMCGLYCKASRKLCQRNCIVFVNPSPLNKRATIFQTIFADAFTYFDEISTEVFFFPMVQLTINLHLFRQRLGAK